ncbi:hypothetical protein LEMLEM_LOCUS11095, partial [Lemmus lemmus]
CTPGADHRTPGADHRTPGADHRTPGADHRMPGADHRTPGADHRTPGADHRTPGAFMQDLASYGKQSSEGRGRLHGTLAAIVGGWAQSRLPHAETPTTRGARSVPETHTGLAYPPTSSTQQQAPHTAPRRRALPAPPSGGARTGCERAPPPRSRAGRTAASARAPRERPRELRQNERGAGRARVKRRRRPRLRATDPGAAS